MLPQREPPKGRPSLAQPAEEGPARRPMQDLTDDQVMALGERARALLENPTFVDAVGGFMNAHLNAILDSGDDDAEGREKHFRQMRCYENVLADLKARVEAADKIERDRTAEQNPIEEDEDY